MAAESGDVSLVADSEIRLLLPHDGTDRITAKIAYQGPLIAPVAAGQPAGALKIYRGTSEVLSVPLHTAKAVATGSLPRRAFDASLEYMSGSLPQICPEIVMTPGAPVVLTLPRARALTLPGVFITIEGGEGGGKSTQTKALARRLAGVGIAALTTREPGGSPAAEAIREALLSGAFKALGSQTEALLFAAARIDHLDQTIKPALVAGTWVVCDRFHDSTRAYQGALGKLDPAFLDTLERVTLAGTKPKLTLVLDLPAEMGLARATARRTPGLAPDRFEAEPQGFHQQLRDAFLTIAAKDPDRCVVIDAAQSPDVVEAAIWEAVTARFLVNVKPAG